MIHVLARMEMTKKVHDCLDWTVAVLRHQHAIPFAFAAVPAVDSNAVVLVVDSYAAALAADGDDTSAAAANVLVVLVAVLLVIVSWPPLALSFVAQSPLLVSHATAPVKLHVVLPPLHTVASTPLLYYSYPAPTLNYCIVLTYYHHQSLSLSQSDFLYRNYPIDFCHQNYAGALLFPTPYWNVHQTHLPSSDLLSLYCCRCCRCCCYHYCYSDCY